LAAPVSFAALGLAPVLCNLCLVVLVSIIEITFTFGEFLHG